MIKESPTEAGRSSVRPGTAPTRARRRSRTPAAPRLRVQMGPVALLGVSDGVLRIAIPLEPAPPDAWIDVFNRDRCSGVVLPRSWNRPIAHGTTAHLSAGVGKALEYLSVARRMIEATNATYAGEPPPAVLLPRERPHPHVPAARGKRPTASEYQRLLDDFNAGESAAEGR